MKKIWFRTKQRLLNAWDQLRNVGFNVKLKYLVWRYKGGENIPAEKLPQILSGNALEDLAFFRLIHVCNVLDRLCEHYNLEMEGLQMGLLLSNHMHNNFDEESHAKMMVSLLNDPDNEVRMFRMMKEMEDITQAKLDYFGPPEGFATMEDWLRSMKDPRCRFQDAKLTV